MNWNELAPLVAAQPPRRRAVIEALVGGPVAPTYRAVAAQLGISPGSVSQHLRQLRRHAPELYAVVMAARFRQLGERHLAVLDSGPLMRP